MVIKCLLMEVGIHLSWGFWYLIVGTGIGYKPVHGGKCVLHGGWHLFITGITGCLIEWDFTLRLGCGGPILLGWVHCLVSSGSVCQLVLWFDG